jgi:hypothetical protein
LRTFVAEIVAGAVFVNDNAAPTEGLTSMFILVFAFIGSVLKAIWIILLSSIPLTGIAMGPDSRRFLPPTNFVVNTVVLAVSPCVRTIELVFVVEKRIFIFVKSIGGAPWTRPIANLISSIPADGSDASPLTPHNRMVEFDSSTLVKDGIGVVEVVGIGVVDMVGTGIIVAVGTLLIWVGVGTDTDV